MASLNPFGYGAMINREYPGTGLAHRISYMVYRGPIPEGLALDHLCRVRCCVNPDHLEPVSLKENILRGFGKGAIAARRDVCIRGHSLADGNTYRPPNKYKRECKICRRVSDKKRYWKNKNAV